MNARLKARIQKLKQQESLIAERNRIAADVHDDIGADLSNLLLLTRITKNSQTIPEPDKVQVTRIENAASSVISKLDEIIWALNPVNDKLVNVLYFIERYAEDFLTTCGITHSILLPEHIPDFFINAAERRNIFLSVKELLNNIYKHSGATVVNLSFSIENNRNLEIVISDNGKGFNPETVSSGGRGLNNIRKRLSHLQGTISFRNTTNEGVFVSLSIPLK
jgi:signal transduction histidine kinase